MPDRVTSNQTGRTVLFALGNLGWGAAVCGAIGLFGMAVLDQAPKALAPALFVVLAVAALVALYLGFMFLVRRLYPGPY